MGMDLAPRVEAVIFAVQTTQRMSNERTNGPPSDVDSGMVQEAW